MVVTLKGDPVHGILRGSKYEIYAMEPGKRTPQMRKIKDGFATKSISEDLDEGKYVYRVSKELQPGGNDYSIHIGAFYVGLTPGHDFCELKPTTKKNAKGDEVSVSAMDNICETCESVWKKLLLARPMFSKGRQTSDGVRYSCGFVGCRIEGLTSMLAMVKHEAEHQGIDLFKSPDLLPEALTGAQTILKTQMAAKNPVAVSGAPRQSPQQP